MKWLVASFLVMSMPAFAQDWIDFEQVLQQQGARVKTSLDAEEHMLRSASLPDGVQVQCVDAECIGYDPNGATGCAYQILLTLNELAAICPSEVTPAQKTVLAENFSLMSTYIQQNAVPMRESGYIDGLVRGRREELEGLDAAQICPRLQAPEGDLSGYLAHMSGPRMQPVIAQLLLTPRLPVDNPCP